MYHAKERGRANFQFYSAEMTTNAAERLDIEADLRQALPKGELEVYYQPQVDMTGGGVVGAEALLRWHHPIWGMVMPDRFIGIAEDTGLIVEIGEWVLRQTCRAVRAWNMCGHRVRVAVNLSPRQFGNGHLADSVAEILAETGCRPEWLEFEITERLLLEDGPAVRNTLEAFSAMGIALAIDDFGTGHSALGYLKRFAVATLKIDRSFIHDVMVNADSAELAKAIVSMAGSLRLRVVAEGIETEQQHAFLEASGCHVGQGYLYGKAMPLHELDAMI
jgi:EAL domain-containing protein (putative c-di-GMP-specific phosphodiesterase class I)